MKILYWRPTCPFSQKVVAAARELGVELELRDIGEPANRDALVARGGKKQVPYLADEARGVEMYESEDVIAYLAGKPPPVEHYVPQSIRHAECSA